MTTSRTSDFDFDAFAHGELPRLGGLFVTATGTEVGKTLVAGAIARVLRKSHVRVEVFKPAASGCRRTREGLVSSDAEFLAACAESKRLLAEINPVRFTAALAPNVAAERAKQQVDLQAIFDAYRRLEGACDCVIVEGVGGLLCPISDDFWVIHLAKLMKLPVVIVAPAGLGTINHTLLTLHAARSAGLEVAGVVINRYQVDAATAQALSNADKNFAGSDADIAMYTNPAQIAERGAVQVLAIVPEDGESSVEKATLGFDVEFAISQVDWRGIMGLE
jgi:dethiobiotin synthetase